MGYIKKQWILVDLSIPYKDEKKGIKKIKDWIEKLSKEQQRFFFTNFAKTNGYMTIFMDWDGSKEGWDTSDKYDNIREAFVDFIKGFGTHSEIYHICDDEYKDVPYIEILH